ncbi:MAG: tetratricopeptide repeat protein [Gemmatimonadetes bacterium]|nr:tetratricopeptide repeat protein [Gemmatimonadota bacterium]
MRLRGIPSLITILATLSIGCAYYNGLYNANRLAKEARRAERQGRRSEAQSLWAQAAVKAESVATRYPGSQYRDDAWLLQGRALSRIGDCRSAVVPLDDALTWSEDVALRAAAGLLLGQCHLELGQPDSAWHLLSTLMDHPDSTVTSRALLWRGRAAMARGQVEDALADLRRTREPDAFFDRASALAELGQVREAAAVLDSARAFPFDERQWLGALTRVGSGEPAVASGLVDGLVGRKDLTSGQRARLLMADGVRWADVDREYASLRFADAVSAAGDSLEGRLATAHLAMGEIRMTSDLDRVAELTDELGSLMLEGGEIIDLAGRFAAILDDIVIAVGIPEPRHPDLVIFRRAEEARDSLLARHLAARLFLLVAQRYPASVIAPKALLAAADARVALGDSVRQVLRRRYPESPYTRAAAGDFRPEYTTIEDSIRTLLTREILRAR